MPDLFYLIRRWWKQMLLVITVVLAAGVIYILLKPKLYLSVATALPASSAFTDKGAIFNKNIEGLYSALGSPDELDRIVGTADLDTVYLAVTDELELVKHYKFSSAGNARLKTARFIKGNTRVYKSGYGDLKIKVWDEDRDRASKIANAILERLAAIYEDLQSRNNRLTFQHLLGARAKMGMDSTKFDELITEYQLMQTKPTPVLLVVENARPAVQPDKPRKFRVLIVALFAGLLFSLFVALVLERRKENAY